MREIAPWKDFGVTIRILETHYLLRPLYNGPAWHGWRLTKADGTRYNVLRHDAPLGNPPRSWWECECADFVIWVKPASGVPTHRSPAMPPRYRFQLRPS